MMPLKNNNNDISPWAVNKGEWHPHGRKSLV